MFMLNYNLQSNGLQYQYDFRNFHISINLQKKELLIDISDRKSQQLMNTFTIPVESHYSFIGLNIEHTQKNNFEASAIALHENGQMQDFIYKFSAN